MYKLKYIKCVEDVVGVKWFWEEFQIEYVKRDDTYGCLYTTLTTNLDAVKNLLFLTGTYIDYSFSTPNNPHHDIYGSSIDTRISEEIFNLIKPYFHTRHITIYPTAN